KPEILTEYYSFITHPFEPQLDPKTKFDFLQNKVSLLRQIDMFQYAALARCFIEVGPFAVAAQILRDYIAAIGYDPLAGNPPTILIQGARGTGMDTVANYAAFQFRENTAPNLTMSLQSVGILTDSQPRLLMLLKQKLEAHFKNVQEANAVFDQ